MGVNSKIESVAVPFISSLTSFSLIFVDQKSTWGHLLADGSVLFPLCEVAPQLWISFDYVTEFITAHSCLGASL